MRFPSVIPVNINSVMEKKFPGAQRKHILFCSPERATEKEEGTQEINVPFFFFLVILHNSAKYILEIYKFSHIYLRKI